MKTKKVLLLITSLVLVMAVLTGCKIKNYDKALIDINNGEDKITLGYANFVFKYNQAKYDINYGETYGASLWTEDMTGSGQTFTDEMKDNLVDTMEQQYVMRKHADEYGVKLTDEDNKKIDDATQKFLKDNTASALNALGADESVVKEFFTNLTYVAKMQQAMTDKGKAEGAINDSTTSSTYINNLVEGWKSAYTFKVDDDLLKELKVDDLFSQVGGSSSNSTTTNSSSATKSTSK